MKNEVVNALNIMLEVQKKTEFNKAKFYAILNFKNAVVKSSGDLSLFSLIKIERDLIGNSRSDAYTETVKRAWAVACDALDGKVPTLANAPTKPTKPDWNAIYTEAVEAGKRAANAAKPIPMVVGSPTTPLGSDIDLSKPTYYVADGVCGFGYLKIKNGGSPFARWCAKNNIGFKGYYGGREIGSPVMTQSMERNGAAVAAMAEVLTKHGVDCYSYTRID
jgi:hypothetical protein